jgi:hypothetical protein
MSKLNKAKWTLKLIKYRKYIVPAAVILLALIIYLLFFSDMKISIS